MKQLHLICNAHIDPVWHWHFNEGIGCAISTFRVAAELCEKDENAFIFNHNEALLYRSIEKYDPELFERIKRLVKAGKWTIMGGWYLQPDCNKPSGESFIRQISRGQKYFREKFGVCPTTAINFDAFGHTKGLVQILDKCGYDSYLFCRPNYYTGKTDMPDRIFRWEGFADTSVTAANQYPYNSPFGKIEYVIKNYINQHKNDPSDTHFLLWGVGNHGGGPSKQDLDTISKMMGENADMKIIHSSADEFFKAFHKEGLPLKTLDLSLDKVMVGCYTSQSLVKQLHRRLENALKVAEMMSTHASLAEGIDYPAEQIEEIEDCLLLSQFHDILPGSSSKAAMEGAIKTLNRGLDIAEEVKTAAFFALTKGQPKGERYILPLFVYNPTPFKEEFEIENEFTLADQNYSERFNAVKVVKNGKELPSQLEQDTSNIPIDWRKRVIFKAELQPMQMNRFDLVVEMIDKKPTKEPHTERFVTISNEHFTFSVDKTTGLISRYTVDGFDYLSKDAGRLIVMSDNQDPWGMLVSSFENYEGSFRLATPEEATSICNIKEKTVEAVRIIDDGSVRSVIEAIFVYEGAYAVVRYFVSKTDSEVRISVKLVSELKHKMVKYHLPTRFKSPEILGKTAFGIEPLRTDKTETVSQEYILAAEGEKALSVVKQGIYGADFSDGDIRISLSRSANYCAHPLDGKSFSTPQDRYNDCIDTGENNYLLAINASDRADRLCNVEREAVRLGQPVETLCFYPSSTGIAPLPLVSLGKSAVSVERIVRSGDGIILHLYNSTENAVSAKVELPIFKTDFSCEFLGFEIRAFKVWADGSVKEIGIND